MSVVEERLYPDQIPDPQQVNPEDPVDEFIGRLINISIHDYLKRFSRLKEDSDPAECERRRLLASYEQYNREHNIERWGTLYLECLKPEEPEIAAQFEAARYLSWATQDLREKGKYSFWMPLTDDYYTKVNQHFQTFLEYVSSADSIYKPDIQVTEGRDSAGRLAGLHYVITQAITQAA